MTIFTQGAKEYICTENACIKLTKLFVLINDCFKCFFITEAEIVEAVKRGARTLDGVKRRTRAGMGRCQGGFCSPRVMEIISRETGIPMEQLTKFGGNSNLIAGKTRPEEVQA